MNIGIDSHSAHLSYCTNIHAGESWQSVFESLQSHALQIKSSLAPDNAFGIGLRLSYEAAVELSKPSTLTNFKHWLEQNHLYVFTLNGFPYGNFHGDVVKDQVHSPDWTTPERRDYTLLLFDLLQALLPDHINEGGISTSPLSYRYWHTTKQAFGAVYEQSCEAMMQVVKHLVEIKQSSGKLLHLDIEPEPDGVIENTAEFVAYYNDYLLSKGIPWLMKALHCSAEEAKTHILAHVQLCYDVCHFAVAFEQPAEVIATMQQHGIGIGKAQLSVALKCELTTDNTIEQLKQQLASFAEPNYLHQAVIRTQQNELLKFRDLPEAIAAIDRSDFAELRTHYHVPVFLPAYQQLQSTQADLAEALRLWQEAPFTQHLEVETYTWDVLPNQMQTSLTDAIVREIEWVKDKINQYETSCSY